MILAPGSVSSRHSPSSRTPCHAHVGTSNTTCVVSVCPPWFTACSRTNLNTVEAQNLHYAATGNQIAQGMWMSNDRCLLCNISSWRRAYPARNVVKVSVKSWTVESPHSSVKTLHGSSGSGMRVPEKLQPKVKVGPRSLAPVIALSPSRRLLSVIKLLPIASWTSRHSQRWDCHLHCSGSWL